MPPIQAERATTLADSFLPAEPTADPWVRDETQAFRSFSWRTAHTHCDVTYFESEGGVLLGRKLRHGPVSLGIMTEVSEFDIASSRFTVKRADYDDAWQTKPEFAERLQIEHEAEYAAGKLFPQPDDWERFIGLLRKAKKHQARSASSSPIGRIGRLFAEYDYSTGRTGNR